MQKTVADHIESFFQQHRQIQFQEGDSLLRANTPADGVFYLLEGTVNLVSTSPKGEEVVITVFKPGSFFPVQAVLEDSAWQCDFSYQAAEQVTAYKAPLAEAAVFLEENPAVVRDLLQRIYHGLDGMFHRISQLMAGSARNRIIQELVIRAKRFGTEREDGAVSFAIKEKELAALSGLTRETVSRTLSELKKAGLAEYFQQTITILNIVELEKQL